MLAQKVEGLMWKKIDEVLQGIEEFFDGSVFVGARKHVKGKKE
jgi:hypothetical protein